MNPLFGEDDQPKEPPPPMTPEQARRELGWGLFDHNDENKTVGMDTPRTV